LLNQERVNFTDNVDVVTYINGRRETHNPTGRAYAPVVWDFYQVSSAIFELLHALFLEFSLL